MALDGIHHVTCITGDAPRNVDFYTRVLGLRLVKKTVNQDDPTVYHLFYADDEGSPGSDITFFEYPGIPRGRAGAGMIHTVRWRVASEEALDFWERRLAPETTVLDRGGQEGSPDGSADRLTFEDPEGLRHELAAVATPDEPLVAEHPEIPAELALQGFDTVRAFTDGLEASRSFLESGLGFTPIGDVTWEARGSSRGGCYAYDPAPAQRGLGGAGTVHHVAWASPTDQHEDWRQRVAGAGFRSTPIIDRFWFRSIYFREPSGVLFEIATLGPGFAIDEDPAHLGESLVLPPAFEHLREQIEATLTPLDLPARASL